ncbi:hypothetical protein [Acidimangrovimonas sediminis]|uniref:hypothetical protein n=1 Tax=Acidimangrovimonas sediminis TaxID=2056283 RepID=UPI000C7F9412|nr:hypothetical protein [Acidimangrovimonas sediminis]
MLSSRPRPTVDHSALRCRLRDPKARAYLHLSGRGVTTGTTYAWLGTPRQADRLRTRAEARGELWPFVIVDLEEV